MGEMYKLYALGVSMIVVWSLPSTLVGLLLAGLIYIHPYSPLAFAYLDLWLKTAVPGLPSQLSQPSQPSQLSQLPQQVNAYFCTHLTKAGTRCRIPPGSQGWCKRHKPTIPRDT